VTSVGEIDLYDTTLRDGLQGPGLSLTVADKLAVAALLDDLGVDVIEGGWPGAIPRDTEFFRRAQDLELRNAVLAAGRKLCVAFAASISSSTASGATSFLISSISW